MRYILHILLFLLLIGCPKPDEDEPVLDSNPQINIPWPSLGDTPWPMHHHDPQSTGRSQYAGPQGGYIHDKVTATGTTTGITLGYRSSVLISGNIPGDFICLDYEGNVKWNTFVYSSSTPMVLADSSILIAGEYNSSHFTNVGDTLWQNSIATWTLGLNIDLAGNLYFIDKNNNLTSISQDGTINWQLNDERFLTFPPVLSFSPDGGVIYVPGNSVSVLAVDINTRTIEWVFGDRMLPSASIVDNDGNLYFTPGPPYPAGDTLVPHRTLYCLSSSGDVNWEFKYFANIIEFNTAATIDYNGNIYFASDTLYSVSSTGQLKWKIPLGGRTTSALICDLNNIVYVGVQRQSVHENLIYAVTDEGETLWVVSDTELRSLGPSPALTQEGTLFYPSWDDSESRKYLVIK